MAQYLVFSASLQGAALVSFELNYPDDTSAWHFGSSCLREGTVAVWQGARYVGTLTLAAAHSRVPVGR